MKNFEELSKKHFDFQAKDYDRKETMYYSKYPKISCQDVVKKLENFKYEKLLDVGCGTGYLMLYVVFKASTTIHILKRQ